VKASAGEYFSIKWNEYTSRNWNYELELQDVYTHLYVLPFSLSLAHKSLQVEVELEGFFVNYSMYADEV